MYGRTAEKGYSRPQLTSGTSRVVLMGLGRVDCVYGPDVRVIYDDLPPVKPRPLPMKMTMPTAWQAAITVASLVLVIAWPAGPPC